MPWRILIGLRAGGQTHSRLNHLHGSCEVIRSGTLAEPRVPEAVVHRTGLTVRLVAAASAVVFAAACTITTGEDTSTPGSAPIDQQAMTEDENTAVQATNTF